MNDVIAAINAQAAANYCLIDRASVINAGGSDRIIGTRLTAQAWRQIYPGVYVIGVGPLSWKARLKAATLAGGPAAVVSHRAAMVLWGLDGLESAPIEITVPVGKGPIPEGVVVIAPGGRLSQALLKG